MTERQLSDLVERYCRFNCDAESSCECGVHIMYRIARALLTEEASLLPVCQESETGARERRDPIPRHTIEQQSGTIYFRLVEDPKGAWVTYANHNAIVTKLEKRIAARSSALADKEP